MGDVSFEELGYAVFPFYIDPITDRPLHRSEHAVNGHCWEKDVIVLSSFLAQSDSFTLSAL